MAGAWEKHCKYRTYSSFTRSWNGRSRILLITSQQQINLQLKINPIIR